MKYKRYILPLLIASAVITGLFFILRTQKDAVAASQRQDSTFEIEVEPELLNRIQTDESPGYLIYFRQRPDLSPGFRMGWEARGQFVTSALQKAAESAQRRVRAYLDSQGVSYKSFWIDNIIVVEGGSPQAAFHGLLEFVEISALRARRQPMLYEPIYETLTPNDVTALTENLAHIKADQAWAMGYTGHGIVVANIDSGVLYTHESLVNQYRGNLGGGNFDHNYNWWDPVYGGSESDPNIANPYPQHGTNTMGIMVGDETGAYQTGMAPDAQWIACQVFESGDIELLECGQFISAPWDLNGENPNPDLRPHVVNNSWGDCGVSKDPWFEGVIESWHAAGIYPVFSNGNASNCGYSEPPGLNTVGNPARYGNVTGVGSSGIYAGGVYTFGVLAPHSNWGPTDDPDTLNPSGYPDLKPQLLAPGERIPTTGSRNDQDYVGFRGTSAAAPHVAGLVALMWDAAPCLIGNYSTTETIIQNTANPIPYDDGYGLRSPNYATGWGEIDALDAVQTALTYCPADFTLDVTPGTQSVCAPDEVTYNVEIGQVLDFTDTVSLTVNGNPPGVISSFSIDQVDPPGTSVLTLSVTTTATEGAYASEVVGDAVTQTHTDTINLEIFASPPLSSTLTSPENGSVNVSELPTLAWSGVSGFESYLVEIATDDGFVTIEYSATTMATSHHVSQWLDHDTQFFWRVTAENSCGIGASSSVFEFTVKPSRSLLLIDDDNDWPDVVSTYSQTLVSLGYGFDLWNTYGSDNEPSGAHLTDYDAVIWFTGAAYGPYTGPSDESETDIQGWLNDGKCYLISSQAYYANRGITGFMTTTLGVNSISNNAGVTVITGTGSVFGELGTNILNYSFLNESDVITPDGTAAVAFFSNIGSAAVTKDNGTSKSTYWGFPFEALPTKSARMDAMNTFLEWCGFNRTFFPIIYR